MHVSTTFCDLFTLILFPILHHYFYVVVVYITFKVFSQVSSQVPLLHTILLLCYNGAQHYSVRMSVCVCVCGKMCVYKFNLNKLS